MNDKVAIIGSGLIGSSWATLFISHGYRVSLYDISTDQLDKSYALINDNLNKLKAGQKCVMSVRSFLLQEKKLLDKCVEECLQLITKTTDLKEALDGAFYAQESTCESLDFKKKVFKQLEELSAPTCILASSTSTIPASKFTEELQHRERCLVAHPVNPPLFLKLVELVPAPWTSKTTMEESKKLMQNIGQEPVSLTKEVVGFAVNRIQFAILSEAWRLVEDDVMSAEDVDKVIMWL
ncbi:unnamed protein product [Auanema sp. JU1783]|nr:unnamed protein product [Auanema sp. JU1783]